MAGRREILRVTCGIETEFGLSLKTEDGKFHGSVSPVAYLLGPLKDIMAEKFISSWPPLLQLLKPCLADFSEFGEPAPSFWFGATGGKIYADNGVGVLEYSTPECESVEDLVAADRIGDMVVWSVCDLAQKTGLRYNGMRVEDIIVTKTITDAAGGAEFNIHLWASQENYQIPRDFFLDNRDLLPSGTKTPRQKVEEKPFIRYAASLLAARQIFSGGGGLVYDRDLPGWRYLISPRAFFTRHVFDFASTARPIVSYQIGHFECPEKFLRLHIPVGDSNMLRSALRFRLAIFKTFLRVFGERPESHQKFPVLRYPAYDLRRASRDLELKEKFDLGGGRRGRRTLPELMLEWLDILCAFVEIEDNRVVSSERKALDLARNLAEQARKDPSVLFIFTDWGLRYKLLSQYCDRVGVDISSDKARAFDILYGHLGPQGIFDRCGGKLEKMGRLTLENLLGGFTVSPRAELRKRYLSALVKAGFRCHSHDWGRFHLQGYGEVNVLDPLIGSDREIERFLQKLESRKKDE